MNLCSHYTIGALVVNYQPLDCSNKYMRDTHTETGLDV